jgi:hypothetical protein
MDDFRFEDRVFVHRPCLEGVELRAQSEGHPLDDGGEVRLKEVQVVL